MLLRCVFGSRFLVFGRGFYGCFATRLVTDFFVLVLVFQVLFLVFYLGFFGLFCLQFITNKLSGLFYIVDELHVL